MRQRLMRTPDLERYGEEIRRENRNIFRLMAASGCVLSMFNFLTQMVVTGFAMPVFRCALLPLWFAVLLFADRVMIPEEQPMPTWGLYLAQAPVFVLAILLGTVWDPEHPAVTILLFLLLSPMYLMDVPGRVLGALLGWSLIFAAVDWLVKPAGLREADVIHLLEFYVGAAVVYIGAVSFRLRALERPAGPAGETAEGTGSLAAVDSTTGLATMSAFTRKTDEKLRKAPEGGSSWVVGFFKLTMMKDYNGTYGYTRGDRLIDETGKALREAFPGCDVGHITAGQFCIFCPLEEAGKGIERALDTLREAHPETEIRGKAGFAEFTGRECTTELIDLARTAQRSIRGRADLHFCFYNTDLDEERRFRQYIISHLDEAIEQEWIQVYYQPIVRAGTGEVCYEEALARWQDPTHGFLQPYRFIPQLESEGLMYRLNLYVVERVLKDCRRREELGVPVVPVSVNLSRKDFMQCDMVKEISQRVERSGYGREMLRLEITESALLGNRERLRREVRRLRESGFEVWMDDFGSEYSTLNLLEELDFDLIKIDMQFMKNLVPGGKNRIILSNMIRMIREMGLTVLTEGVETREQVELLRELGCDLMQGYYFNRPNSFEYIVDRARRGVGLPFEKQGRDRKA